MQLSTGIKVLPTNWQPTKKQQVSIREADDSGKSLALMRLSENFGKLFTLATGQDRDEAAITADEVRATAKPPPEPSPAPAELPPAAQTLTALYLKWQQKNVLPNRKFPRRHAQVADYLARFNAGPTLEQFTRKLMTDYHHYTQHQGGRLYFPQSRQVVA